MKKMMRKAMLVIVLFLMISSLGNAQVFLNGIDLNARTKIVTIKAFRKNGFSMRYSKTIVNYGQEVKWSEKQYIRGPENQIRLYQNPVKLVDLFLRNGWKLLGATNESKVGVADYTLVQNDKDGQMNP